MLQYAGLKNKTAAVYSFGTKIWARECASQQEAEQIAHAFLLRLESGDVAAALEAARWYIANGKDNSANLGRYHLNRTARTLHSNGINWRTPVALL